MEKTLQFASPEEEISYLRGRLAAKERELLAANPNTHPETLKQSGREVLREYKADTDSLYDETAGRVPEDVAQSVEAVLAAENKSAEILSMTESKGIRHVLAVLEKTGDAFTVDDVHRRLIEYIKSGRQIQGLKEDVPPWHLLHMTLFEVTLPEVGDGEEKAHSVKELVSVMEQFYSGMQSIGYKNSAEHLSLEIAVSDKSDDIVFYVALPSRHIDLLEKQLFSLYPLATLTECVHDYNIFVDGGVSLAASAKLKRHPIYPLRLAESFEADPLNVILNAFSKIEKDGGGASLQIIFKNSGRKYLDSYQDILKKVRDGMKPNEAIQRSKLMGELFAVAKEMFVGDKHDKREDTYGRDSADSDAVEVFTQKVAHPIAETNIRLAVSAKDKPRAEQILYEIEAAFNQFENTRGNSFGFQVKSGSALRQLLKAYSFREFSKAEALPLSYEELALLMHFPSNGIESSPEFKQSRAQTAPAPNNIPGEGTLLGESDHRGSRKKIYITPEDRLRHFYIIGQTGTGKSVFMKNIIIQDIQAGTGVCMIDPHGTDIRDVLSAIPPEREGDVIYFDPSYTDFVIGLNMLEYDPAHPEQKTFVVNELFSIFQRLYGANPESMGPMFEQYFRNATLLVMEDPESGNTLMDISRVMSDAAYRELKLSRARNPVVLQFWRDIAAKAGGEAALENIVPYIVSKFDVFTANDYMRPIIGQQRSSFNFRQLMDERKILLVNLSKGRLGEINANLIGMIIVGKILMAALSRVDDLSKSYPPFYLHIDEFQNVTTNSISAILSEARKYKLGLTVAHQFIAQLEEGIRDSVFGNVGSVAAFRVGTEDAAFLEKQFAPMFGASDLMNIPNYHAYLRVLANGTPTKPFSVRTLPPPEGRFDNIERILSDSYGRYARPLEDVEAEISARYNHH